MTQPILDRLRILEDKVAFLMLSKVEETTRNKELKSFLKSREVAQHTHTTPRRTRAIPLSTLATLFHLEPRAMKKMLPTPLQVKRVRDPNSQKLYYQVEFPPEWFPE